jgi:hypothetical protein
MASIQEAVVVPYHLYHQEEVEGAVHPAVEGEVVDPLHQEEAVVFYLLHQVEAAVVVVVFYLLHQEEVVVVVVVDLSHQEEEVAVQEDFFLLEVEVEVGVGAGGLELQEVEAEMVHFFPQEKGLLDCLQKEEMKLKDGEQLQKNLYRYNDEGHYLCARN